MQIRLEPQDGGLRVAVAFAELQNDGGHIF